jgi:hypothetical protein
MQALIQLMIGFVAMMAAAVLSQFGLNLDARDKPQREIHRVRDCGDPGAATLFATPSELKRDC